jgi:hypothetical protein
MTTVQSGQTNDGYSQVKPMTTVHSQIKPMTTVHSQVKPMTTVQSGQTNDYSTQSGQTNDYSSMPTGFFIWGYMYPFTFIFGGTLAAIM